MTRAGEQNINVPFLLPDYLEETLQVGDFRRICLYGSHVLADNTDRSVKLLLVTTCDEHVGAFLDEELRRR